METFQSVSHLTQTIKIALRKKSNLSFSVCQFLRLFSLLDFLKTFIYSKNFYYICHSGYTHGIIKHLKMDQNLIRDRIKKTIHEKDPQAEAYLFGSRARGDFRPDSDWDIIILVDANKITNEIEDKFRDDLYDIEIESGQIISTFIYPKDYWRSTLIYSPLYKNVNREGILL